MRAVNNPEDEGAGTSEVPDSDELYIERDDFMEDAPRKFFRLKPGGEVRLRAATGSPATRWSRATRARWSSCVHV